MSNLEYLNLMYSALEEVHHSLGCCSKLIRLNLYSCKRLKRFPRVNVESLEYLSVGSCSRLEKFSEIHGRMKPEIHIHMRGSRLRELPSSITQYQTHITKLDLSGMRNLESLPEEIGDLDNLEFPPVAEGLRSLEHLDLTCCNLIDGGLPEDIGSLSSLEELNLSGNNFEHFPRSIAQLGALRILDLSNKKESSYLIDVDRRLLFWLL
ncbi:TMV resistance protein N-like [Nicotiana tomentosiformis]|uniref:TMV resistance protein N-like n=1 Tax=Nicotiana tomentosiformis TaxID=4098 RepID=UPI00388CC90F